MIACHEKFIKLILNGDLFETLIPDLMHSTQYQEMDLIGSELFNTLLDALENMILRVLLSGKIVYFFGDEGNHCRIGQSHDDIT
jgi:hypothetical protein